MYLEAFLYLLLRDKLPAGAVEYLVIEAEALGNNSPVFSNEQLAIYAKELTSRLKVR